MVNVTTRIKMITFTNMSSRTMTVSIGAHPRHFAATKRLAMGTTYSPPSNATSAAFATCSSEIPSQTIRQTTFFSMPSGRPIWIQCGGGNLTPSMLP